MGFVFVCLVVLWLAIIVAAAHLAGGVGMAVAIFAPFVALGVWGLRETLQGRMDWWGNPTPKSPHYQPPPRPAHPPTDRQLNLIDNLILERGVPHWMIEREPETLEDASILIDDLHELPYRDD